MTLGMPALLGGIVLMYLYDSALLIYHDEVAFETRGRGALVAGGFTLELGGRHLFVPNPLTPRRPLHRLSWLWQPPTATKRARAAGLGRLQTRLAVLMPWSALLFALFAIGLPACLWMHGGAAALLGWLVATYATILASLGVAYAHRRRLGITGRQIVALARDALLCPPFAINLLRKVSLQQSARLDLRTVMASAPAADATIAMARMVQARIATSLTFAAASGDEEHALHRAQEFYRRFAGNAH